MKLQDLLNRAADIIQNHGWVQGHLGEPCVGFCMIGAINYAYSGFSYNKVVSDSLTSLLGGYRHVWEDWNDHPKRRANQVIRQLRKFATKAKGNV